MRSLLKKITRRTHVVMAVCVTTLFCVLAYLGAFFLRFDFGEIPQKHIPAMLIGLPLIVFIRIVVLTAFHVHRGLYRYADIYDVVKLFKAITLGSLIFVSVWWMAAGYHIIMPRSIYLIEWMLCMAFLVGLRMVVRLWRSRHQRKENQLPTAGVDRMLIVGAGDLGEVILRIVDRRFLGQDIHVVGFVDSDEGKLGSSIHDMPVLGNISDVRQLAIENNVQVVLFAVLEPEQGLFEGVVTSCDGLNLKFSTVSLLKDVTTGEVSVQQMRDLKIEDLLGRSPVELDARVVQAGVQGKTILVTGAGGSIGSELCRQIASFAPQRIVLLDNGETPLFEIDRELRQLYPTLDVLPFVGDVKYADVVDRVFAATRPEFVYHAAAYKHVPLMESHPDEAVLNNVLGTRYLAEVAYHYKCKRFVMISSDKAVHPTSVMGATKRMCELVVQKMNGGATVFTAVRFGNVLGSNGSVIPIFKKQIETGGPLTVTHPEMTRFFMTIPEAVSLVLQCGVIAAPGDIFVLDMGSPVKVMDLARNMIRLSGLRENVDVSIKITGLRPGEKMYEELIAYGEELQATSIPKVNVLKQTGPTMARDVLFAMIHRLVELSLARRVEEARAFLWRLVALDDQQNLSGIDGLSERPVHTLAQEWLDVVKMPFSSTPVESKGRVLAVVADLELASVLRNSMSSGGYELDCVDSPAEAIGLLACDHAYIAILCDYIMPTGTVWHLRDQVRALGVDLPVVAMSVYESKILSELLGVDSSIPVLHKPFDPVEFEATYKFYLQQ